jgi:hypothetical protein
MYKCNQCDKQYESPKQLGGHIRAMIKKGDHIKIQKENKNPENINGKSICPYCNKEFPYKGIGTHIWYIHRGRDGKHTCGKPKGTPAYNKGLTKETSEGVKKAADTYKRRMSEGLISPSFLGKKHSKEAKEKLSKSGGYRKGSGRGKSGWYKGYWCDSTWELAWIIYNIEHGVQFSRNTNGFHYNYREKKYKFFPDFILADGTYVEIKGYMDDKNVEKIKQFNRLLQIIVGKVGIKPYLDYVISKYGKDFKKLYEIAR